MDSTEVVKVETHGQKDTGQLQVRDFASRERKVRFRRDLKGIS